MQLKDTILAQDLQTLPDGKEFLKIVKNSTLVAEGIRKQGDKALFFYVKELSGLQVNDLEVGEAEFKRAESLLSETTKLWLTQSVFEAEKFYGWPREVKHKIEVSPGVQAWYDWTVPKSVGIYVENEGFPDLPAFLNLAILAQSMGCQAIACTPSDNKGFAHPYVSFLAFKLGMRLFKAPAAVAIAAMSLGGTQIPRVEKVVGRAGEYGFQTAHLLQQTGFQRTGLQPLLALCDKSADLEKLAVDAMLYQRIFPIAKMAFFFLEESAPQKFMATLRAKVLWSKRKNPNQTDFPNLLLNGCKTAESFFKIANELPDSQVVLCVTDPEKYTHQIKSFSYPYFHKSFLLQGSFQEQIFGKVKVSTQNRSLFDSSTLLGQELFQNKLETDLDVAP